MDSRDIFFQKLKAHSTSLNAKRQKMYSFSAKPTITDNQLRLQFIKRLTEAGGEVFVCSGIESVKLILCDVLANTKAESLVVSRSNLFEDNKFIDFVQKELPSCKCLLSSCENTFESRRSIRDSLASTFAGVGNAIAGFADSGAVAIQSTREEGRLLSLLTEIHIAVLFEKDLYQDLQSFAPRITTIFRDCSSSAITFIAGPSKTADIEKVLVTGVHGPRRFIVLLVLGEEDSL